MTANGVMAFGKLFSSMVGDDDDDDKNGDAVWRPNFACFRALPQRIEQTRTPDTRRSRRQSDSGTDRPTDRQKKFAFIVQCDCAEEMTLLPASSSEEEGDDDK